MLGSIRWRAGAVVLAIVLGVAVSAVADGPAGLRVVARGTSAGGQRWVQTARADHGRIIVEIDFPPIADAGAIESAPLGPGNPLHLGRGSDFGVDEDEDEIDGFVYRTVHRLRVTTVRRTVTFRPSPAPRDARRRWPQLSDARFFVRFFEANDQPTRVEALDARGRVIAFEPPDVDAGVTIDAERVVGSDRRFEPAGATTTTPYYLLRGSRWTPRVAFRTAPGSLRVLDTRSGTWAVFAIPAPCVPRDVAGREVLLECSGGTDLRILRLETGSVARVPTTGGMPTSDFRPLALGRAWILGEECGGDPLLATHVECTYEFVRRSDGYAREGRLPRDIDTARLGRLRPRTDRPPYFARVTSDTQRMIVLPRRRRITFRCAGPCRDEQLVGRWATWRDDAGVGVVNIANGRRGRLITTPAVALERRPGRRVVVVEPGADGSNHVHVLRF